MVACRYLRLCYYHVILNNFGLIPGQTINNLKFLIKFQKYQLYYKYFF